MTFSGIGSRVTTRRSYSHERLLRFRAWHPIIATSFVGKVLRAGRMLLTLASVWLRGCSTAKHSPGSEISLSDYRFTAMMPSATSAVPATSVRGGALNWRMVPMVTAKTGTRKK